MLILSSEVGVLDVDEEKNIKKITFTAGKNVIGGYQE